MIGIAAVILTVGLGEGAQEQVSSEINALGTNLLTISPGSTTSTSGIRGGFGIGVDPHGRPMPPPSCPRPWPPTSRRWPRPPRSREALTVGTTNWTTSVVGTIRRGSPCGTGR